MIDRLCAIARALTVISLLAVAGAQAQTAQSPTSSPADTAGSKSPAQATGQPDKPSGPQINTAEIVARANKTVGVDIQKRITAWQQGFSRLESDLQKPRLRYSELNDFRDELQRVRGEIDSFRTHLEPALAAAKDQLGLLGPAPAAGQPPEPEDVAQSRAERNYYLGLLSAGQAAIDSANLHIDNLIDTIQDIRRKNFTTRLLQPVPGIYSSQTWSRVPDYIPSATHRVRDIKYRLVGQSQRPERCVAYSCLKPPCFFSRSRSRQPTALGGCAGGDPKRIMSPSGGGLRSLAALSCCGYCRS